LTVLHHPAATAGTTRQLGINFGAQSHSRTGERLALALGFFAYLPYPAIPAGNNTGIQVGNLLTLLMMLPVVALPWRRKSFMLYPVLVIPILISAIKVCVDAGDPLIGFKLSAVWIFSMLTLVAAQVYAPRYPLQLMIGIAVCALLHAVVGAWQLLGFHSGYLPLEPIYVNPAFASVQEASKVIVRYVQRPFGLFPEPSAMASSLGPWLIFWLALSTGLVRLRVPVSSRCKALFATAALASLALIFVSRSGHTVFVLAGLGIVFCLWLIRGHSPLVMYGVLTVTLAVVLPILLWLTMQAMQSRLESVRGDNDSWQERSSSLIIGGRLTFMTDGPTMIFGMGIGQSNDILWDNARLEAVWSVLLTYIYEQGVFGIIAVGWIAFYLIDVWRRTHFKAVLFAVAIVWLIGITLTTSYEQLLPTWLFLGWMSVWRDICDDGKVEASRSGVIHSDDATLTGGAYGL
jgi:hypothetical protein